MGTPNHGHGFNYFMCKKDFHPGNWANLSAVYEARQKQAAKEKREGEMMAEHEREVEHWNAKAQLGDEKAKLGLSFMYDAPSGLLAAKLKDRDHQGDEKAEPKPGPSKPSKASNEPRLVWQRGTQPALPDVVRGPPRPDFAKELTGPAINDKPFAVAPRHARCSRCKGEGHEFVDNVCSLFNRAGPDAASTLPSDIIRAAKQDKEAALNDKKTEFKKPAAPPRRSSVPPPPVKKEEEEVGKEAADDDDPEMKEHKLRLRILSRLTAKASTIKREEAVKTEPEEEHQDWPSTSQSSYPSNGRRRRSSSPDVVTLEEEDPQAVPRMNYCQLQAEMVRDHKLKLKGGALQELCVIRNIERMGAVEPTDTVPTDPSALFPDVKPSTRELVTSLDSRQMGVLRKEMERAARKRLKKAIRTKSTWTSLPAQRKRAKEEPVTPPIKREPNTPLRRLKIEPPTPS